MSTDDKKYEDIVKRIDELKNKTRPHDYVEERLNNKNVNFLAEIIKESYAEVGIACDDATADLVIRSMMAQNRAIIDEELGETFKNKKEDLNFEKFEKLLIDLADARDKAYPRCEETNASKHETMLSEMLKERYRINKVPTDSSIISTLTRHLIGTEDGELDINLDYADINLIANNLNYEAILKDCIDTLCRKVINNNMDDVTINSLINLLNESKKLEREEKAKRLAKMNEVFKRLPDITRTDKTL